MRQRARELGIVVGSLPTGPLNAITDVAGVMVGHQTIRRGESIRTGVTAILPHGGNLFQEKVPAGIHVGNGFGKLAGITQVQELGTLETPIVLTNTLNVGTAMNALVRYTLEQPGNEKVFSVNAVVGETNDGYLNDIRGQHVTEADVFAALNAAKGGPIEEGAVGAGTGTSCFGFKGGIGTASRRLPAGHPLYTVGVLVQSNYGGQLIIDGRTIGPPPFTDIEPTDEAGSCMIIIATDAPLNQRNLERLAARAMLGLARTGSYLANGSGDYAIAFAAPPDPVQTSEPALSKAKGRDVSTSNRDVSAWNRNASNFNINPLFLATVEATQEAVYNAMLMAETTTGHGGRTRQALRREHIRSTG